MSLLSVSELSFAYSFGAVLFEDVSFSINPADRMAIVGPNGSGKSTLLRLLAGELEPGRGKIVRRRGLTLAISGQDAPEGPVSLFDFVFGVLPALAELRIRMRELEQECADANAYAECIHDYEEAGGYAVEREVERSLEGLGFAAADFEREVRSLSGGERTRASLARALSARADLLILDEPTNHLDLAAREWLEQALEVRAGACVLTSHDRALLSQFAGRIVEIGRDRVRVFEGGYGGYRKQRAVLDRQAWTAFEASERRKAVLEAAAERREKLASRVAATPDGIRGGKDFYARKAAKVARTARLLRERTSGDEAVEKPWEEQPISRLSFERVVRSGDIVLTAVGLAKSYGARTLFRDVSFTLRRGERLAITGPNGSGKTTLLDILNGATPDKGSVCFGANVERALVAQNPEDLDAERTPLEICGTDANSRTLLACLKLRPECLNRPVRDLSGGERTKVALARILNSRANLLLLDEPTNHLEIEAQEALEQALARYPGTIIAVSHDRWFLEAFAPTATLEVGS